MIKRRIFINNIKLISADLDGTLIGKLDASLTFKRTWEKLTNPDKPLLCYNTGRLLKDTLKLVMQKKSLLPKPDYLICGIGTQIYDAKAETHFDSYDQMLNQNWNLDKVDRIIRQYPQIKKQPRKFLNPFKSSWYLHDAPNELIDEIRETLFKHDLSVHVIYSSSQYLDILPLQANKAKSLLWLMKKLNISAEEVIVTGDSGNDTDMFLIPNINGIIVENAQPELYEFTFKLPVYSAQQPFADGVLEGLEHYQVIPKVYDVSLKELSEQKHLEPELSRLIQSEHLEELKSDQLEFLQLAYNKAIETIKKNITPIGFSACSLTDNEVIGTDANYRSVWGRDGAITILGTLGLKDADIRACQRNTLMTLIRHISPNGQIPSNVMIDTNQPEYSGVGRICSIDSGIWTIIAFYEYINQTQEKDLLFKCAGRLQNAMNWLSAQDSNNDGLLEIPEAGDWTDLFGRSYNILYDEVLWYRANVCFGKLLELLGNPHLASDYMRWAQRIKNAINDNFWPTTQNNFDEHIQGRHFADMQFSMGDTRYLLAQVTPFSFNWRCDIFGNVLAVLANVIDLHKAQRAFRFMWEVGVNQPYPVSNLYPVVQSGDPDWRNYYTVNLLNLPNHYHNGGIWPFVGGFWVRYINRLGMRDIAIKEFLRLAELNQKGKIQEWEFNEWAHGLTGNPMGKSFQAWSAATFIWAYHDLNLPIPNEN